MTSSNESALVFLDEEMAAATLPAAVPWRILIVDDDEDVHETTQYALQNMLACRCASKNTQPCALNFTQGL